MCNLCKVCLLVILILILGVRTTNAQVLNDFSVEERQWLVQNSNRILLLGVDPASGIDNFVFNGVQNGYLMPTLELLKEQTGLNIRVIDNKSWSEVYNGLQTGSIDILFGANVTAERLRIMTFTEAIQKEPYNLFTQKNSKHYTLSDLKGSKVGYLEGDYIASLLNKRYPNVQLQLISYPTNEKLVEALAFNAVDAIVIAGEETAYQYKMYHPEIRLMLEFNNITSDKTFSVRKEDQILSDILKKFVVNNIDTNIKKYQSQSRKIYNWKALGLTEGEIKWLKKNEVVHVGIDNNYLPYEYADANGLKGINGEIINEVSKLTGIKFKAVVGKLKDLEAKVKDNEIDMISIIKTRDRQRYLNFGEPYDTTRDIILGKVGGTSINHLNDLEGKCVAVINGYWHEEYLRENLSNNVKIIITDGIEDSMELVHKGQVDCLIDNPVVIQYYMEALGYNDLIKLGNTTQVSNSYFAVTKSKPELESIMKKGLAAVDFDEMRAKGLQSSPRITDINSKKIVFIFVLFAMIAGLCFLIICHLLKKLIDNKVQLKLQKEIEMQLLVDPVTGVGNRNAFVKFQDKLETTELPQALIVLDVNNLKKVNDIYGHTIGDALLMMFGKILIKIAGSEFVFRIGGDEFIIVLPGCDEENVIKFAEKFESEIFGDDMLLVKDMSIIPFAAIGYAIRESIEEKFSDKLIEADNNMYQAKAEMKCSRF